MKQALVRFLVYLALLVIVFAVFGAPTPGPLSSQLDSGAEHGFSAFLVSSARARVLHLGYYAVAIGFWLLVFELTYRVCRRLRKPVDMP
jgi:hypothetical protein